MLTNRKLGNLRQCYHVGGKKCCIRTWGVPDLRLLLFPIHFILVILTFLKKFKPANSISGIKLYISKVIADCRSNGHIQTLMGRRRYLQAIQNDGNPFLQSQAERQALNSTIQGSAADIVKFAMNNVQNKLKDKCLLCRGSDRDNHSEICHHGARFVLQLHDELMYEVDEQNLVSAAKLIKHEMEHAFQLRVPLKVNIKSGNSWGNLEPIDIL